jgi:hypothetical protein
LNWHPSDDDLVLHFYGDADKDADRVDAHLRTCPSCAMTWAELRETLSLVDAATTPEPGAGFERVVWARLRQALPARPTAWWRARRLVPIAALAVVTIAVGITGYRWRATSPAVAPVLEAPVSAEATARRRERVLLTALDDHFEQTEVLLVELMNAPLGGGTDLSFERSTADDLVFSGRLYRITAQQNGELHLVQMLEDLESVLVEVARGPERRTGHEVQSLRARIDDASLLFKVRAVSDVIHVRQRELMSADD